MTYLLKLADTVQGQIEELDPTLQAIVHLAVAVAWVRFRKFLIVTSLKRADGVHALDRGVDLDVDDQARYGGLSPTEAQSLSDYVNKHVCYDPDRAYLKCAVYGLLDPSDKHWNHIHLQTHPQTMVNDVIFA